ncbi:FecR family protein [Arenicella xantha]|uniref:FecR family protein n=1 Tax=Arenicella xantha TaxID=644221 RepID=A0A395JPE4_9GAMM|nr:FecR domain-containing protein [Arenicella xantha]RBP51448.1 FecR family protein [Arenicella xantha]
MNTLQFPSHTDVTEGAALWIAKIDRGLSAHEERELSCWLEQSSLHGEALVKCASMWDLLDVLKPLSKFMPMADICVDAPVEPVQTAIPHAGGWGSALAASVILAIGVIGLWSWLPSGANSFADSAANSTAQLKPPRIIRHYQTAVGETTTFALSDGSLMQLNTDSKVAVEYSASERHIELIKGEVFFDVAKNAKKPFVVESGEDRVTAVGTAFSVDNTGEHSMEVIVTEGKVLVNRAPSTKAAYYADVLLIPGQRVVVRNNQPKISTEDDPSASLAWRDGFVVFNGEPLSEVVREIDRYTSLSFKITDPSLAEIPVGGYFKTGDLDQLLLVLQQNFGVASRRDGDQILLSKLPG